MKPKTKLEKRVTELYAKLRPITDKQKRWGVDNCIPKFGYRSRNTIYCLECGHSWKAEGSELMESVLGFECPSCGLHLEKKQAYKADCSHSEYFRVFHTVQEFQVIRTIQVRKTYRLLKPVFVSVDEVMQHWINEEGKVVWLSKSVQGLSGYIDRWVSDGEMSIKRPVQYTSSEARYWIDSDFVYPRQSILPIINRNGFKGDLHGFNPVYLFPLILTEPHFETLFKANRFNLMKTVKRTNDRWNCIKICLRNGYEVSELNSLLYSNATLWFDYLDLLEYFGKDLNNAKYVCPNDLKAEHDRLVVKKREIIEKEKAEKKRQRANEQNEEFLSMKSQFIGLCFKSDQFTIKTLDSVNEYMEEGDKLHHCIFVNDYALKKDSLCLSARINEQPIETIEVDLSKMAIVQCRGLHNQHSEHHDRIMQIVTDNLPKIAKRANQPDISHKTNIPLCK